MNIDFNSMTQCVKNQQNSELSQLFNHKLTENGDYTHKSTGNHMVDLIFQSEYFQKHLDEVRIGNSDIEKLFSMFVRDPRHGMKYRNLGRVLMRQSGVSPQAVAFAGRFDDLWESPIANDFLMSGFLTCSSSAVRVTSLPRSGCLTTWLPRPTERLPRAPLWPAVCVICLV